MKTLTLNTQAEIDLLRNAISAFVRNIRHDMSYRDEVYAHEREALATADVLLKALNEAKR